MSREYFIEKEHHAFALDASIPPVLSVQAPCTITFETGDVSYIRLYNGETMEEIGSETFNMVTGPVFVEGTEAGDVLRLEILDITVNTAWAIWFPGAGVLGDKITDLQIKKIPIEGDWALINDNLKVPVEPMIGCVGVAPVEDRSSTMEPAYPWGGNMDLRELTKGAVLYLPVQVPGALLSMGDLHAAQGAGEATDVALESAGEVTVKLSIEKDMNLKYPRVRTAGKTICVGISDSLEEAAQIAYDQAYDLLVGEFGLTPFDAYAYSCARVGIHFGGPASAIVLAEVPDIAD